MTNNDPDVAPPNAEQEPDPVLKGGSWTRQINLKAIPEARLGLIATFAISLLFFLWWWNEYVPPVAYGDLIYSTSWGKDFIPYRDFFAHSPPGFHILMQLVRSLFGPKLKYMMMFGVIIRVAGACSLYFLLARVTRPLFAVVATVTALFLAATEISDLPHFYNHMAPAFVLIGIYLGLVGAEKRKTWNYVLLILSGFFLCYAPTIKQTMVFGSLAGFLALFIMFQPRPAIGWIRLVFYMFLGFIAAVAVNYIWLLSYGIVDVFLQNIATAPQGKGGVVTSLLRPIVLLVRMPYCLKPTILAWILLALFSFMWFFRNRKGSTSAPSRFLVVPICLLGMVYLGLSGSEWNDRMLTLLLTALGWWGSLLIFLFHIRYFTKGNAKQRDLAALGVLAFGIGYATAVSWPLIENMAFPGFAVVLVLFLENPPSVHRERWIGALLAFAGAVSLLSGYRKSSAPYSWGLWFEPPLSSKSGNYYHPALDGLRISLPASNLFAAVTKVTEERSRPGDRIYVFPNIPMLYGIANRQPATYGLAHWVDVCPDFLGKKDAETLIAHPPKILIIRRDPIELVLNEEDHFRNGRQSSVRTILAAIEKIKPRYQLLGTYNSGCTLPIDFWALPDEVAK